MSKLPDHSHGAIFARGLTVPIDKDTLIPWPITGRNAKGRLVDPAGLGDERSC
jgi:hypothetical protein